MEIFKALAGVLAIVIGIMVAWITRHGVVFMKKAPEITTALIVGIMVGFCFFRGLPVGPLLLGKW